MMYLSRMILNPRSKQVRSELANPYEMHRTIGSIFSDVCYQDAHILFRVDINQHTGIPTILIQSTHEPDWSALPENGYLFDADENPATKVMNLKFEPNQVFVFRLRANPTKRDKASGKRIGLRREEEQIEWLVRKGKDNGFAVVSCRAIPEGIKRMSKGGTKMSFLSVRFDGVLQVTDADKLLHAVEAGIGPAKAFGFGLLSLAPTT